MKIISGLTVYTQKELSEFNPHIIHATKLWAHAAGEYYKKHGDTGTCIVGDGIGIYLIPKGCRKPQKVLIIPSSRVAHCQGSSHYEATKSVAMEYLREQGLETHYNYGFMD